MPRIVRIGILACVLGSFLLGSTAPAQLSHSYRWKKGPSFLALLQGDHVVWQFNHLGDGKEKGCPYFHPLGTTEGAVLTDRQPADHPWHRGLRFAWKKIDGVAGYWSWPEGLDRWPDHNGMTEVTSVHVMSRPDFSARFELVLVYHPPGAPPVLTEHRVISVSPPDADGTYRIDWCGEFQAGAEGALLDRTPIPGEPGGKPWGGYAGLQFRLAPRKELSQWALRNSVGTTVAHGIDDPRSKIRAGLLELHGKPAKWMRLSLVFRNGARADVALLDHPDNLRHPSRWHTSSMPNELIQTPLFTGPYRLKPHQRLTMRYRILVSSSRLTESAIAAEWEDFAGSKEEPSSSPVPTERRPTSAGGSDE